MNRNRFAQQEAERLQHPVSRPAGRVTDQTLNEDYRNHQAGRPGIPHGLDPEDPEFVSWYHAFVAWAHAKTVMEARLRARYGMRGERWYPGRCA